MNETKSIIWLASYPKSGNTWARAFLSRILYKTQFINQLQIPIYSSKNFIEQETDVDISELTLEDLHQQRLRVFAEISKKQEHFPIKIHDIFQQKLFNMPFLPFEQSRIVVYLVRNPFDVAISFSRHLGKTIDETIEIMNNSEYTLASSFFKYQIQMPQLLGTWSEHIKKWTQQKQIPIIVIRYEDMLNKTKETFINMLKSCEINFTDNQLEDALYFTNFKNLQKQEKEHGFEEKSVHSSIFFHTGKSYYYQQILTTKQIKRIYEFHYETIKQFDYEPQ